MAARRCKASLTNHFSPRCPASCAAVRKRRTGSGWFRAPKLARISAPRYWLDRSCPPKRVTFCSHHNSQQIRGRRRAQPCWPGRSVDGNRAGIASSPDRQSRHTLRRLVARLRSASPLAQTTRRPGTKCSRPITQTHPIRRAPPANGSSCGSEYPDIRLSFPLGRTGIR